MSDIVERTADTVTAAPSHPKRATGLAMVLVGATLWGLSGTAAQELFQADGFTPGWLVAARMGVAGVLLLSIMALVVGPRAVVAIWRAPKDRIGIVVFGLVGLVGVQYTYFASIQLGNAATATFLQYLAPAFIFLYLAVRQRRRPSGREQLALALAIIGTFLLVTNGSVHKIVVPGSAVLWGLLSAVALAFYTLYPEQLILRWGSALVMGWGMLIGAAGMCLIDRPWAVSGQHWSLETALLTGFVIIFGTLVAFYLYLASMSFISPAETSLVASFEPLSAAVAAVVWLHTRLGLATIIGGLCILGVVVALGRKAD